MKGLIERIVASSRGRCHGRDARVTWCVLVALLAARGLAVEPVKLHWLSKPATSQPSSFGVPWPRGQVTKEMRFSANDSSGRAVALQTWPMAYWPDGSIKWTGCAIEPTSSASVTIAVAKTTAPLSPIQVEERADGIHVRNGAVSYVLSKDGEQLIQSIEIGGREIAAQGELICSTAEDGEFIGVIKKATIEQSGPVRVCVKFEGVHECKDRALLPFVVRLYFTAGSPTVRMVHTFIYDGDAEKDSITSMGLRFDVPLRDEPHNRHFRFGGDSGMFAEPVQVMVGRRNPDPALYAKQIAGEPVPPVEQLRGGDLVKQMAVWSDIKLSQLSAESFSIYKREDNISAYIHAMSGHRSLGVAFLGDSHGGLALWMKNFWQMSPTGLEIRGAGNNRATLTAWLYSPDAEPMDLRHYSTKAHGLEASYEDVEPGFSTPYGVARTHELSFTPFAAVPRNQALVDLAQPTNLLLCDPKYYHDVGVFGVWSLPDRTNPAKAHLEDQLDHAISFYEHEVDQRHWYGFWDFGDVMHTYDTTRHEWKYDVGGYAWANTELMPDLWLWYSFLRTGRADIYRMAEAMTRHTQEVDCYHIGRFAPLGSRHNVRHWGDGAKEMRISQAFLKRFYYYLSTDERTADLITEVYDADKKLVDIDPLRKIETKTKYPTHIRIGPDWFAAYGNWMTAYERTLDKKYLDKALVGMHDIASFPHKFFSGDSCGYDPASGHLYLIHPEQVTIPHLAALMGGPEVCMEFNPLVNDKQWNEAWLNYCEYLQAPREVQEKEIGGTVTYAQSPHFCRMTGYAANALHDGELAKRAWRIFLGGSREIGRPSLLPSPGVPAEGVDHFATRTVSGPDVPAPIVEIPNVSTNDTSQWSLNAIELLQLIGDSIPPLEKK